MPEMTAGERLEEMNEGVGVVLHDMCQPLTVLRCKLELGLLFSEPAAMREALEDSLEACMRLSGTVDRMRSLVERVNESGKDRGGLG